MLKVKQVFLGTSNLGYSFHSGKAKILYWTPEHNSLSVLSAKLDFFKSVEWIKNYGHLNVQC